MKLSYTNRRSASLEQTPHSLLLSPEQEPQDTRYRCTAPYPSPLPCLPRCDCGRQVQSLCCGQTSELSSFFRYIYHSLIFQSVCPEVAETFWGIAECELWHLRLLGLLQTELAIDPQFVQSLQNGCPVYWSAKPSNLGYTHRMDMALLMAIENERACIRGYEQAISQVQDDRVKLLLRRIVMDEDVHLQLLEDVFRAVAS